MSLFDNYIGKTNQRDDFGPLVFNTKGVLEKIPRCRTSCYKHVDLKSLILNNGINDTYTVCPNYNIKCISESEANTVIRKYIWNNFFGLSNNYKYSETTHYPMAFKIYLRTKLLLNVGDEDTMNNFVLMVRNVIFTRIIFLFKSHFIQITNSLINTRPIKIQNDPMYEINQQWRHWVA